MPPDASTSRPSVGLSGHGHARGHALRRTLEWLEPTTWWGTIALFVGGFIVVQTLMSVGGFLLVGWPLPVKWRLFYAVVIATGTWAGSLWWIAHRQRARWLRWWLRASARVAAMVLWLHTPRFEQLTFAASLLQIVFVTLLMGALMSWAERWGDSACAPAV